MFSNTYLKGGSASQPQLVAFWNGNVPDSEEVEKLQQHHFEGDVEFVLMVTRTITEDRFKRIFEAFHYGVTGEQKVSALSVLAHLKQTHPGEFEQFAQACWHLVPGFPEKFPQTWPACRFSNYLS